ncbi:hypothetical protein N7454_005570 [Penicillium verhagenii]|nr:hypothetical protein N7454_005570 [Penicillium verhagenii]
MQLSLFVFGLLANVISAVPTPETQSTCLTVRKTQPQPQIYGWESILEYLVFHTCAREASLDRCPLGNLYNTLSAVLDVHMPPAANGTGGYVVFLPVAVVVAVPLVLSCLLSPPAPVVPVVVFPVMVDQDQVKDRGGLPELPVPPLPLPLPLPPPLVQALLPPPPLLHLLPLLGLPPLVTPSHQHHLSSSYPRNTINMLDCTKNATPTPNLQMGILIRVSCVPQGKLPVAKCVDDLDQVKFSGV